MSKTSLRFAAVALAAGTAFGGFAVSPASAEPAPGSAPVTTTPTAPTCTLTAEQRVAITDQVAALTAARKALRPSVRQKVSLGRAIAELHQQNRQQRLSAEQRQAKRTELVTLARKLRAATSATERAAIRTEMDAVRQVLRGPRLTAAQVRELKAKIATMKVQLAPHRATASQRLALTKQIVALKKQLECASA